MSRLTRRVSVLVVAVFLTAFSVNAQATSLNALMGMPAFTNLVLTIARVNQAMRSAAQNPMDDFRRKNVRTAISAMPAAIAGLANEFQAGRLHNGDLKFVQSLLGGFVDVNAADNYKKFLQSPSASLIPQVGSALPANLMRAPAESVSSGAGYSQRIEYDDSAAKRGVASDAASVVTANDDTAGLESVGVVRDNTRASQSVAAEAARDLASLESQAREYRIQSQPRYWQFGRLMHHAEALLIHSARAEGDNCPDCKKGGAGGGPGGGGGDAATVLFGLAAMMGAIAPMVTAGMQANADKEIAQQQASAQMYITDRTVQNSERLAQIQQQTALQTAQLQSQVAAQNNQGVSDRLQLQLASLEKARQDSQAMELQRMQMEQEYNNRRIELAQAQAQQNLALAQQTIGSQLTQAGLSQGMAPSMGGTGLSVTPTASTLASTLASASTASDGGIGSGLGFTSEASTGGQRLLASLSPASEQTRGFAANSAEGEANTDQEVAGSRKGTVTAIQSRLLAALRTRPTAPLVSGSSRRGMVKSDITSFIGQPVASTSQASFAQYQSQALVPHAAGSSQASAATARGMVGSGHAGGAYNAP